MDVVGICHSISCVFVVLHIGKELKGLSHAALSIPSSTVLKNYISPIVTGINKLLTTTTSLLPLLLPENKTVKRDIRYFLSSMMMMPLFSGCKRRQPLWETMGQCLGSLN